MITLNYLKIVEYFIFSKLRYLLIFLLPFSYTIATTTLVTSLKNMSINTSKMCYQHQITTGMTLSRAQSISVWAYNRCKKYDEKTFNYIWENNIYPVFVRKNEPNELLQVTSNPLKIDVCDPDVEVKDFCPIYDENFINSNNHLTTMKNACLEDPVYTKNIVEERLFWSHDNKLMSDEEAFLLGLKNMYPVFITIHSFKSVKDMYAYMTVHDPYLITPERVKVYTICPKE